MEIKSQCPIPTGILVIIGGKENKGATEIENRKTPSEFEPLEILKSFISQTKKENPVIEVITSASSVGEESFTDYKKVFEELNISSIGHIHHTDRKQVLEDALIERINRADGVFFAGGDQLKYTSIYGGTAFLSRLKERYIYENLVIAGTSAGAMAMSTPMIYAGNDEVQEIGGEIKITTGLMFLKDVCIDTHFVSRGRFVRMAQVVMTNPSCIGIGIEEDTAIIVKNGTEAEVIGSGLIIIIDGFHMREASIDDFLNKKPFSVRDLKVHILSSGDTYQIPTNTSYHL